MHPNDESLSLLAAQATKAVQTMRQRRPLVHNITNFVVMQVSANALLAAGASPLMAHAPEELEDLLQIASALVLNIGTLDTPWIASMRRAGILACERGIPVVLDPVGAGASRLRTGTARMLLQDAHPCVVRGNGSEILTLAGAAGIGDLASGRGVDSLHGSAEACTAAVRLARHARCVVSVSGEQDLVTDGDRLVWIRGGSPVMTSITGMGCSATALTAACVAGAKMSGGDTLAGAVAGMALMAEAGDRAAEKSQGPGSFLGQFLDALHNLDPLNVGGHVHSLTHAL